MEISAKNRMFGAVTMFKVALVALSIFAVSALGFSALPLVAEATGGDVDTEKIYAKSLLDYECDATEWHFVITGIEDGVEAPQKLKVTWESDSDFVHLDEVAGTVAHYRTADNLDDTLLSAWTYIGSGWDGQFNVSHGPCADEEEEEEEEAPLGAISVCKAIVDDEGNVVDGSEISGTFELQGLDFNSPAGLLPLTTFNSPLSFNADMFSHVDGDDTECVLYEDLAFGDYYYGEEVVTGDDWLTPMYNDQHTVMVGGLTDFFPYSGELFTADLNDDSNRNTNADGHIVLSKERPNRTLVVLNTYENEPAPYCGDGILNQTWEQCDGTDQCTSQCVLETVTIVASKVMCESEDLLPNWGAGGPNITETTAIDFVAENDGCYLEEGWSFQYGDQSASNPGDNTGEAGEGWTTFGPTNLDGVTSTSIDDVTDITRLWVREVFVNDYVLFTHAIDKSDVSAEMYCGSDVLNYDNYDYISNPEAGETYHCVAFNAPEESDPETPDNSCPFEPTEGRIIINFEEGAKIFDIDSLGPHYNGPVDVSVPAGTYTVSLASFDGYLGRSSVNQPAEVWKLVLKDGHTFVVESSSSTDLPDDVDYVAQDEVVDEALIVPVAIDKAKAWHAAALDTETVNSVEPVCAALDVVEVAENQKPVITLRGDDPVILTVGETYTEEEADVQDPEDGDIDEKLVIAGDAVNTSVADTYIITYNATDTQNLAADEVTRTVVVEERVVEKKACSDRRDNDGDGLIDKLDPGCHTDGDPTNNSSYDPQDDDEYNEIPYAPYCGDGEVNQEWEDCDGGEQCTAQCQLDNQCVERAFARVNTNEFENHANGDVTSDVFLGSLINKLPGSAWFLLYDYGTYAVDPDISGYENVPGLAVERQEGKIRTLLYGSHENDGSKEHINGDVEFFNIEIVEQLDDASGNNKLEKGFDGVMDNVPGQDEVWLEDGNDLQSFFWLTVTTADDAFFTKYGDAPMCEIPNQKPVITVLHDNPQIIPLYGTYTNLGALAYDPEDGDISDDIVLVDDNVDTNSVGVYIITYDVVDSLGLAADTKTREVHVVDFSSDPVCSDGEDNDGDLLIDADDPGCWSDPSDSGTYNPDGNSENQAPVITLRGDALMQIILGGSYTEEEADVDDVEEGDIDGNLVIGGDVVDTNATGTYTVTYNASDSQGAPADEVTREVTVVEEIVTVCSDQIDNDEDGATDSEDAGCWSDPSDPESYDPNDDDENSKPVITLRGDSSVNLNVGDTYTEQEADVDDAEDGDIDEKLVIGGDVVDTDTAGTYIVTYNATDTNNLAADEVTRTVTVTKPSTPGGCTSNCGGGGGRIPDHLRVFNENITVIGEGTALITWETNKPADSRVVYDDDSQTLDVATLNFGTGSADLGYEFTTETNPVLTLEHSMIVTNVNLEDLFYFRPLSSDGTRAIGIELSAVLGEVTGASCEQYLFEFIKFGENNNPEEVRKLQIFLNDFEGSNLEVTGVYDIPTFEAVEAFQNKHAGDVLSPWGLEGDTGYVYLTTRKKINEIYCNYQLPFPLTDAQQAEVNGFKQLLENLEAAGQPLPDTSNVGFNPSAPTFAGGDGTPNVTLTEETTEGGDTLAEGEGDGTDSLAAAADAVAGEGGGILSKIGNFFKGLFR